MMTHQIPFEVSLFYILIIFFAVLLGFWMGRITIGEPLSLPEKQGEYHEDADGDIFMDAMRDPDDDARRATI